MTQTWDPVVYQQFDAERGRPFFDLTARVAASAPRTVVDLGCGPGTLTATLAERWPDAHVVGVDSSPQMLTDARPLAHDRLRFQHGDVQTWQPARAVDVLVSNATLQWVPGHLELLPRLVDWLAADGWLAVQVPGNFGEPSHTLLRSLARDPRFAGYTAEVAYPAAHDAETYLTVLRRLGQAVEAWETTYLHVLSGPDPVLRWISGTGARPVLQALPDEVRNGFVEEYAAALRDAYPVRDGIVVLPFRRVFFVAHRED